MIKNCPISLDISMPQEGTLKEPRNTAAPRSMCFQSRQTFSSLVYLSLHEKCILTLTMGRSKAYIF